MLAQNTYDTNKQILVCAGSSKGVRVMVSVCGFIQKHQMAWLLPVADVKLHDGDLHAVGWVEGK